jgi:hypothetical protein
VHLPLRIDLGALWMEPSLLDEKWDGGAMGLNNENFDTECAIITSGPGWVCEMGLMGLGLGMGRK